MSSSQEPPNDRQTGPLSALDALTGRRLPGGCDDCDAYQTVTHETAGVYRMVVHHDETCPFHRSLR
jgi:hypothetical protein